MNQPTQTPEADDLSALGYADDAAIFLLNLRQFRVRLQVAQKRLAGIWRAVEWVDSGDSSPQYIKDELAKYRGETNEQKL